MEVFKTIISFIALFIVGGVFIIGCVGVVALIFRMGIDDEDGQPADDQDKDQEDPAC